MSFDPTSVLSGIRNKRRTQQTPEGSVDTNKEKSELREGKTSSGVGRMQTGTYAPQSNSVKDDELTKTTINLLAEQLGILQARVKELERVNSELSRENEALKREREGYFSVQRNEPTNGSIPSSLRGSRDPQQGPSGFSNQLGYHSKTSSDLSHKGYGSIAKQGSLKQPSVSTMASGNPLFGKKLSSAALMAKSPMKPIATGLHGNGQSGKPISNHSSTSVSNGYLGLYNSKSNRQVSHEHRSGQGDYTSQPQRNQNVYTSSGANNSSNWFQTYQKPTNLCHTQRGISNKENSWLGANREGALLGEAGSLARDGRPPGNKGSEEQAESEFDMFRWFAAESQDTEGEASPSGVWGGPAAARTPTRRHWKEEGGSQTQESTPTAGRTAGESKWRKVGPTEVVRDLRLEVLEQIVRLHPNTPVPHVTLEF